jgi:DNA repair exonuclease SbcCD ATPase subunit
LTYQRFGGIFCLFEADLDLLNANASSFLVFMTKASRSKNSLRSVSPVTPSERDLIAAMNVLNNSLDSRLLTDMMGSGFEETTEDATVRVSELSPTLVTDEYLDQDTSMLIKCQTLIDELQTELDSQRDRNSRLESELKEVRSEVQRLRHEDAGNKVVRELRSEVEELRAQLTQALQISKRKDTELENMTKHCEKRLNEMKQQLKQQALNIQEKSPHVSVPSFNGKQELLSLRSKLETTEKRLYSQTDEMKSVVDSYERQLKTLREQLEHSQEFYKNYYSVKAPRSEAQRCNPFRDY